MISLVTYCLLCYLGFYKSNNGLSFCGATSTLRCNEKYSAKQAQLLSLHFERDFKRFLKKEPGYLSDLLWVDRLTLPALRFWELPSASPGYQRSMKQPSNTLQMFIYLLPVPMQEPRKEQWSVRVSPSKAAVAFFCIGWRWSSNSYLLPCYQLGFLGNRPRLVHHLHEGFDCYLNYCQMRCFQVPKLPVQQCEYSLTVVVLVKEKLHPSQRHFGIGLSFLRLYLWVTTVPRAAAADTPIDLQNKAA